MKLYKKVVRFIVIYGGWQGFRDEIRDLTDWMPEEEADEKEKELKEKYKDSWGVVRRKIDYIPVEDV